MGNVHHELCLGLHAHLSSAEITYTGIRRGPGGGAHGMELEEADGAQRRGVYVCVRAHACARARGRSGRAREHGQTSVCGDTQQRDRAHTPMRS